MSQSGPERSGMSMDSIEAQISRIDERTRYIQSLLEKILAQLSEHDERLNSLEKWQSKIIGGMGLLTFLTAALLALFKFTV